MKETIAVERPELVAERQKLIHNGKVLKDTSNLTESGINENDFIVCMVTKESASKVDQIFVNMQFAGTFPHP